MSTAFVTFLVLGGLLLVALLTTALWLPRAWYRALFYPDGRPSWMATQLNSASAKIHSLGLLPSFLVSLEVKGRRTGQTYSTALVVAELVGARYLVSMLGENVDWVKNIRAAQGEAVLRHGRVEQVTLEEVPVGERAPILKAYLGRAPGGRPHFEVPWSAPVSDFERVAARYPVFRVVVKPPKPIR